MISRLARQDAATLLRYGVLALAALGLAGTSVELVFLRHWTSGTQLLVWPAVVVLAIALLLLVRRPDRRAIRVVRVLSLAVGAFAIVGDYFHVVANLDAGPLDRQYAATWDTLGFAQQLWLAATGSVGPAPALTPGVFAEIALALLLATLRHAALEAGPTGVLPELAALCSTHVRLHGRREFDHEYLDPKVCERGRHPRRSTEVLRSYFVRQQKNFPSTW